MLLLQHRLLSKPAPVQRMDIGLGVSNDRGLDEEICDGSIAMVELAVTCTGQCHGIALWTDLDLIGSTADRSGRQETMPLLESGAPSTSRPDQRQGLHFLDKPHEMAEGDTLMLVVRRYGAGARLAVTLA